MQKKLSLALSIVLFTGLTNSVHAEITTNDVIKIGAYLTALGVAGDYVTKMNEQYTKENKDPDLYMEGTRAGIIIGAIIGLDIITGDLGNTPEIAVKLGSLLIGLPTQTPLAADLASKIPYVGGILTSPKDEQGREKVGLGSIARFACVYGPLRDKGLKYVRSWK